MQIYNYGRNMRTFVCRYALQTYIHKASIDLFLLYRSPFCRFQPFKIFDLLNNRATFTNKYMDIMHMLEGNITWQSYLLPLLWQGKIQTFIFFIHLYIRGKVYSPPKVKKTSSKKYKLVDKLFYFQDGFNARMLNAEMSF